ncbi:substrate-binding periplasmic protein [Uliginosibacterium gangwonense]|uniref:substrate-binding periplasmic protein n=1 Tax=Uliginosibacterium gangwonense TaxID=392736 RepID=UPI000380859C|nr:transporter substrate-binding domain-containing protein [Uliginosibacterium gangwonense]
MKITKLLCTFVLAIVPLAALAADPLIINFDQANPPFMYSKDGKVVGIYPAVIDAAFKQMKTAVSLQAKPWARALQEIDQSGAGVGGIYKNAEREKKYDFSDQIFTEKLVVYFAKAHPITFSKVEDLKGKKVGVLRGWSYGDEFDAARKAGSITADETTGDDLNFQKLDIGRVDAVIAVAEAGDSLLQKYKTLAAAAIPLAQNPTYLAFSKSANKAALLKQFNETIKAMKASGELGKLVSQEVSH